MSKLLTPEEEKALQERELLEKEKEKKAALLYFSQAYFDKVILPKEEAERKALYDAILDGFDHKKSDKTMEDFAKIALAYDTAVQSKELVNNFMLENISEPDKEALQEDLKKLEFSEADFATIALFGCGKNAEKLVRQFSVCAKEQKEAPEDKEKLIEIRDEGVLKARSAIAEFKKGDPYVFAQILFGGLFMACGHFAEEPDSGVAMQWSLYAGEIVNMLRAKPELLRKSGLTEEQLRIGENVASLGKDVGEGLEAIGKTNEIKFNKKGEIINKELSREINKKLTKMRNAIKLRREIMKNWDAPEKKHETKVKAQDDPVLS